MIQTVSTNNFSANLDESIQQLSMMFQIPSRKFNLPNIEKWICTYVLTGPARTHYLHNRMQFNDYIKARAMMLRTYNCVSRQLQVVPILEQLRNPRFMAEKDYTDPAQGLKGLVDKIESPIPLTHPAYHFETHKVTFLKRAVVDQPWAKEAVKNINALNYSFNDFVTALHDTMQVEQELKTAKLENWKATQKNWYIILSTKPIRI